MTITVDGNLADWSSDLRVDAPSTGVSGYALYGTVQNGNYVFGLQVPTPVSIGQFTTFWLNTDLNDSTGEQAFGGAHDTGAEYFVDISNTDGVPLLYRYDGPNQSNVTEIGPLTDYAYNANKTALEFSIPAATLGQSTATGLDLKIDVNNATFLPTDYSAITYPVVDPGTLPAAPANPIRIAIVSSATSAAEYSGGAAAYNQLITNAENQATAAGIQFDVLSETDLENINTVSQYGAIVFPAFRNVNSANVAQIQNVLTEAVNLYNIPLITAGEFMTNDQTNVALPGNPYIRMQTLLDLGRVGGAEGSTGNTVDVNASDLNNPMMQGYTSGQQIEEFTNLSTSWYGSADGTPVDTIATETITPTGGSPQTVGAILGTHTGATNVSFANESVLLGSNMLARAIQYVDKASSRSLLMPTIAGTVAGQTTTSEASVRPFSGVTIGDANAGATETLTITVSGSGGVLSGTGLTGGTGGLYTLLGTASTITSELDALTFTPVAGTPGTNTMTTFKLTDLSSAYPTARFNSNTSVIDVDPAIHANDLTYASTASGYNHFIDLPNFEASYADLIHAFGTNQQAMQSWYNSNEPQEKRVETFDGLDYIASYGDLINAFSSAGSMKAVQDAGASHFITNGLAEGRSTTFNGLDYIASYGDLINAFGANSDAGAYHYIENGHNEGRTTTFDGLDYIASYGDLINAFGANEQAGAAHYITNGVHEGRTTTFDGLDYIAQYTDLMSAFGANNDAGASHYITNGSKEGRSTGFDVAGYEQAHPDLIGQYASNDAFLTAYINTYTTTGHFLT